MDIYPLANNRRNEADQDETDKIQSAQMEKPSAATVDYAYQPKRHKGEDDISESAMNPSVEHCTKEIILHGIKIRLYHFPKEVQKKGMKTKTCLWYSENP